MKWTSIKPKIKLHIKTSLNQKKKILTILTLVAILFLVVGACKIMVHTSPRTYAEATADGTGLTNDDWDPMVLAIRGFTPAGVFTSDFDYLITYDGTDYYAVSNAQIAFGGPDDVGEVDGGVLLDVVQAAVDDLGEDNGTVYLKNLDEPAGLTVPANVTLVSFYSDGTVGGNTCKMLRLDELLIGTRYDLTGSCNRQIIEIQSNLDTYGTLIHVKPNGDVTGEHRAGIAFWNLFNQGTAEEICELTWSGLDAPNRWFLFNTFASGTGAVYPIVFSAQAGDEGDPLGGKVAEVTHGGGAGAQRFIIWRGLIPNNYPLNFLDTLSNQTAYIKMDDNNVFSLTNLKNTDMVFTVGTGGAAKYIRLHASGDLAIPNLQKVAFENAGATATTDFYQAADGTFVINHPEADNIQITVNGKTIHLTSNGEIQLTENGAGFITKSPDGTVFRISVSNLGAIVVAPP